MNEHDPSLKARRAIPLFRVAAGARQPHWTRLGPRGAARRAARRPAFGSYRGRFEVGPEFFEPLSPDDLASWGED